MNNVSCTERAGVILCHVEPAGRLSAELLLLCDRFIAPMGRTLHHAVINRHVVLGLPAVAAAPAQLFKRDAELLRHQVVDDGVDGAVGVDAHPAEEEEPGVVVRRVDEGVDHHQRSVRHPQQREEDHHHGQHLRYLLRGNYGNHLVTQLSLLCKRFGKIKLFYKVIQ